MQMRTWVKDVDLAKYAHDFPWGLVHFLFASCCGFLRLSPAWRSLRVQAASGLSKESTSISGGAKPAAASGLMAAVWSCASVARRHVFRICVRRGSVASRCCGAPAVRALSPNSWAESVCLPTCTTEERGVVAPDDQGVEGLRKIYRNHKIDDKSQDARVCRLNYADFKGLIQAQDPSISNSAVRSLFIASVEASRSCFQYEDDACPATGTLDPAPNGLYGGDIVTLQHMGLAVVKTLMKDQAVDWTAGKSSPTVDNKSVDNSPSGMSATSAAPSFQLGKSPNGSAASSDNRFVSSPARGFNA
eukprot:s1759_g5.t1